MLRAGGIDVIDLGVRYTLTNIMQIPLLSALV